MPSIYKQGDKWRAQVRVKGKSATKRFTTKAQAVEWAYKQETALKDPTAVASTITLAEVLDKYVKEVSIHKPSYGRESKRAEFIKGYSFRTDDMGVVLLAEMPIAAISKRHINAFAVDRRKSVRPGTLLRDFSFLGAVFEAARSKWEYIKVNPVHEADKPPKPQPRSQRITDEEIQACIYQLGYTEDGEVKTVKQQVAVAFLIALETAMRLSEIINLEWDRVQDRSVYLPKTKNGDARVVPLSKRAVELLNKLPKDRKPFSTNPSSASSTFRKARHRLGFMHFDFHDSRREATSRLAKKFDVLMLAKITGHNDLKMLLRVYYAPELSDFLDVLDN